MRGPTSFGANSVTYPDERVFLFSPYKCVVTGTAVAQAVVFTFNGKTLTRYTGSDKKVTISLQKLFQSSFYNVETGMVYVAWGGTYDNIASKLLVKDKVINVAIGASNFDMTFDILYGALQQGETEATEETIYCWRDENGVTLPLTITKTVGDTIGVDMWVSDKINDEDATNDVELLTGATVVKTYHVQQLNLCPESYYLRWIDRKTAEYKYYNFLMGRNTKAASNGATFNYNVLELSATNGLYKNTLQTLEKISTETITVVEPSADLLQQTHIQSIFDSPKVWLYMGNSEWMEVNTSESSFEKIRNDGKKEIQVNIILPQKYNIRL